MRRWTIILGLLLLLATGCSQKEPSSTGFLQENFAFVAAKNTVQVIDVAHKDQPKFVTEITLPGEVAQVVADGRFAYIIHHAYQASAGTNSGLQIVDMGEPTQPQLRGTYDTPNTIITMAVQNELLALAHWGGVTVMDVSNKDRPEVMAELEQRANGVFWHGDQLLTTWGGCDFRSGLCTGSLSVYDVSRPQQPQEISHLEQHELPADAVTVANGHAFINGQGVWVVELTGEPDLQIIGRYQTGVGSLYNGHITIQNNIAYVHVTDGLLLLDISQPAKPTELSLYNSSSYLRDFTVRGDYAYLISERGLEILDVTDAAHPERVGRYTFAAESE